MYAKVKTDIHLVYVRVMLGGLRVHEGSPTLVEMSAREYLTGLLGEWWHHANGNLGTEGWETERTVIVEAQDQYGTIYTVLRNAYQTHVGYMEVQE